MCVCFVHSLKPHDKNNQVFGFLNNIETTTQVGYPIAGMPRTPHKKKRDRVKEQQWKNKILNKYFSQSILLITVNFYLRMKILSFALSLSRTHFDAVLVGSNQWHGLWWPKIVLCCLWTQQCGVLLSPPPLSSWYFIIIIINIVARIACGCYVPFSLFIYANKRHAHNENEIFTISICICWYAIVTHSMWLYFIYFFTRSFEKRKKKTHQNERSTDWTNNCGKSGERKRRQNACNLERAWCYCCCSWSCLLCQYPSGFVYVYMYACMEDKLRTQFLLFIMNNV